MTQHLTAAEYRAQPKAKRNKFNARKTEVDGIDRPDRFRNGLGVAAAWIYEHASFAKNECLIWPFARSSNGYGSLTYKTKGISAHKFMCEVAHGKAPSKSHLATHSCGNGHLGCVNPRHLVWGTYSKNMMDRVVHGTDTRGTKHYLAKLTDEDVILIRSLRGAVSEQKIADHYGVGRTTIADIMHRRTWAWL